MRCARSTAPTSRRPFFQSFNGAACADHKTGDHLSPEEEQTDLTGAVTPESGVHQSFSAPHTHPGPERRDRKRPR